MTEMLFALADWRSNLFLLQWICYKLLELN